MIEYKIGCLLRQLNTFLIQYGTESDITPSQGVLLNILLNEDGKRTCSSDICAGSGLSRASVSEMLKNLRNKGYLEMKPVPEDERKKEIILTEKAYAIREDVQQELEKQGKCMCRGISGKELVFLEDILERMVCNLRECQESGKKKKDEELKNKREMR